MWQQIKTPVEHSREEDIDLLLTQAASWLPAAAAASTSLTVNYIYITHFVVITGWYWVLNNVVALLLLNTWRMCHHTFMASILSHLFFFLNDGAYVVRINVPQISNTVNYCISSYRLCKMIIAGVRSLSTNGNNLYKNMICCNILIFMHGYVLGFIWNYNYPCISYLAQSFYRLCQSAYVWTI